MEWLRESGKGQATWSLLESITYTSLIWGKMLVACLSLTFPAK